MVIQTRDIKTMVGLISSHLIKPFFSLTGVLNNGIIKQIMKGPSGKSQIYLPLEIKDRLPKKFYLPRRS